MDWYALITAHSFNILSQNFSSLGAKESFIVSMPFLRRTFSTPELTVNGLTNMYERAGVVINTPVLLGKSIDVRTPKS